MKRDHTSDLHECAAILDTNIRGARSTLADHGIEPAFYDNGRPHFVTADVRRIANGRPILRTPPRRSRAMY